MNREDYRPGPAEATLGSQDGDTWSLVLVRELRHSPDKVWGALTDPNQLAQWAPFDADRNLDAEGPVRMSTVGAPSPHVTETVVTKAEAPHVLEYKWGGGDVRWQLEAQGSGTRLTLWAAINRQFVAMGAAGWQVCLDVLDHLLDGDPIGRMAGMEVLKFKDWQRLNAEYNQKFGVESPKWVNS